MVSATPEVIHDQLSAARLQLKKWQPEPWALREYATDRTPTTPSEWFSKQFPEQARIHGCPFIELVEDRSDGLKRINPLAQNLDFWVERIAGS